MRQSIAEAVGEKNVEFLNATDLATGLLGDSIAGNLFMLGFVYQRGLVPLSGEAIERAIALNGVAVEFNRAAFRWGRRAAVDPELVRTRAIPPAAVPPSHRLSDTLDQLVSRRAAFLTDYQNTAYAARYASRVERVREAEAVCLPGETGLTQSVARSLFKLMAYKDEYEVARLYTDTGFLRHIADRIEGPYKLTFHLAPPLLGDRDPETGHLRKRSFGPWMLSVFRILARLRGLRGTPFDMFGRTKERQLERRLINEYEALINEIVACLSPTNHQIAVELASLPAEVRGFGHVKEATLAQVKAREKTLLARLRSVPPHALAAE
jgi:indolepyruvate ferredoxin oxidoreductase